MPDSAITAVLQWELDQPEENQAASSRQGPDQLVRREVSGREEPDQLVRQEAIARQEPVRRTAISQAARCR